MNSPSVWSEVAPDSPSRGWDAISSRPRAALIIAILLCAGCLGATVESPAPRDQSTPGTWTTLAPMPTARQEVAVAALEGRVYVIGDFGEGAEPVATVEAYNPATNSRRPDFAEGWNKRATVYYLPGEYQKSLADCDEVMKRNAYHFGALSGHGMIHLQLGEPDKALGYFERALAINPNLAHVEEAVAMLRRLLRQRI